MKALDMHLRSTNSNSSYTSGCKGCNCCPNCCCAANNKAAVADSNGSVESAQLSATSNNSSSTTEAGLSKLERFAIILASAVHDLGHPGVNNVFLVKTRDKQALTYNDRSVNENMHASLAFTLALEHDDLNLFRRFSTAEYEQVTVNLSCVHAGTSELLHCKEHHQTQVPYSVRQKKFELSVSGDSWNL